MHPATAFLLTLPAAFLIGSPVALAQAVAPDRDAARVFALAQTDVSQSSTGNLTTADLATLRAGSEVGLKGFSGQLGANAASGSNNVQGNAIAEISGAGITDARAGTRTVQHASRNVSAYAQSESSAMLALGALENARGTIGVNFAAGANNLQHNSAARIVIQGR